MTSRPTVNSRASIKRSITPSSGFSSLVAVRHYKKPGYFQRTIGSNICEKTSGDLLSIARFIDPPDLLRDLVNSPKPRRYRPRLHLTRLLLVVCRRGDRQLFADRLDPILGTVLVNKRHHYFGRRSISAWAKKAAALRGISLARFNARFSRSSSFRRSCSELVSPAHLPWSRSACRTHSLRFGVFGKPGAVHFFRASDSSWLSRTQ